jgi:hypothetical protein
MSQSRASLLSTLRRTPTHRCDIARAVAVVVAVVLERARKVHPLAAKGREAVKPAVEARTGATRRLIERARIVASPCGMAA